MIGIDTNGDRRFYQVDIDDDTTYVSPPMNFPEPLRALEVSDISGNYYVISDADQTFYEIDPINGTLTALFPIPGYQNALGYLHTFDYDTDQYLSVGMDTLGDLQLYSIFPASGTISSVPFPVPAAAYYGLEATNTQFIARMLNDLTPTTSLDKEFSRYFQLFPNPSQGQITLKSSLVAPLDLQVLSLEGKILWEGQMVGVQQRLDLPALPDGIYLIRITDSEKGRSWQQSFLLSP
ncbi:MAG: T9SS type A sorting domain-containing protein, partial [Bacteroidota bacterium]